MRKAPPLSLSVKSRRWEFTFFPPVSSLVEHRSFSSSSLWGMTEQYLMAALNHCRQKKKHREIDDALVFFFFSRAALPFLGN